jgi:cobalt-zinc-cadmium efflux system protein
MKQSKIAIIDPEVSPVRSADTQRSANFDRGKESSSTGRDTKEVYNLDNVDRTGSDKSLKIALVLNSLFTVFEIIAGWLSGSLALIADAIHNATDVLTLLISFIANRVSRRSGNQRHTFGFGRATILAAQLNSVVMILVAGFISIEAYQRLFEPLEIEGSWVILVASSGVLLNGAMAWLLSKQKSDLNMRSAFIDLFFDALSSVGAVAAGIILVTTGFSKVDSIVAFIIAALLLFNAVKIFAEAISVLLEGTPRGLDLTTVESTILEDERIITTDDIHLWAIRSNYNFLACHIVIENRDLVEVRQIVDSLKARLLKLRIQHTTIEVENPTDHLKYSHTH